MNFEAKPKEENSWYQSDKKRQPYFSTDAFKSVKLERTEESNPESAFALAACKRNCSWWAVTCHWDETFVRVLEASKTDQLLYLLCHIVNSRCKFGNGDRDVLLCNGVLCGQFCVFLVWIGLARKNRISVFIWVKIWSGEDGVIWRRWAGMKLGLTRHLTWSARIMSSL